MKYNLNVTRDEYLGINILNIEEIPECIIKPNVLQQKGSLLFEGPAKVGKTDFVLSWMINMAAGIEFLSMKPVRPLKIFYLHADSVEQFFEEKIQAMNMKAKLRTLVQQNLKISPYFKMKLGEQGVEDAAKSILENFALDTVDIIVIDSVEDFYDGNIKDIKEGEDEALVEFSETRLEDLRQKVNPNAAQIVIRESNRMPKEYLQDASTSKVLNNGGNYAKL